MPYVPLKVTFDRNVYEFIIDPDKKPDLPEDERKIFKKLNDAILGKIILPFISETILTYETVAKAARQEVLAHNKPIIISNTGTGISIYPNPEVHPGLKQIDGVFLEKAIKMGFKILPGMRFGKLIHPSIQKDWYYYLDEGYLITSKRFSLIVKEVQDLGAGYFQFESLINSEHVAHLPRYEKLRLYKGTQKKLSDAVAEWSDGDSVALHIAYGIDFFCSNDRGRNAGQNSALGDKVYHHMNNKFGFKRVSPEELYEFVLNPISAT